MSFISINNALLFKCNCLHIPPKIRDFLAIFFYLWLFSSVLYLLTGWLKSLLFGIISHYNAKIHTFWHNPSLFIIKFIWKTLLRKTRKVISSGNSFIWIKIILN